MVTWVPHIGNFIVPQQLVALGDATRRSCDACESFGAMVKKLIKHSTCRRRVLGTATSEHGAARGTPSERRWRQTFNRGFIEQAFRRACVRESLAHGPENVERTDVRRTTEGRLSKASSRLPVAGTPIPHMPTVYQAAGALLERTNRGEGSSGAM